MLTLVMQCRFSVKYGYTTMVNCVKTSSLLIHYKMITSMFSLKFHFRSQSTDSLKKKFGSLKNYTICGFDSRKVNRVECGILSLLV